MVHTNKQTEILPADDIAPLIRSILDQGVILDSDLAAIYGVETKSLNRAVKRNAHRFPPEFVFILEPEEITALRCQIGTLDFKEDAVPYRVKRTGARPGLLSS